MYQNQLYQGEHCQTTKILNITYVEKETIKNPIIYEQRKEGLMAM